MIEPRKTIRDMDAYNPPLEGRRGKVRLDFNENTAGSGITIEGLPDEEINTYPEYNLFMTELSKVFDMPIERMLPTNGTGEAISLIAFTFIEPSIDKALTSDPTFALIPHYLKIAGAKLMQVPSTNNYDFDLNSIEANLESGVKLVILASPDNPTGAMISPEQVLSWCERYPKTLFVIDEAYAEYSDASSLALTLEFDNLLVTRTFSKSWGMAGLRLGVIFGSPRLMNFLRMVRAPYSVNSMAVNAARAILGRKDLLLSEAKNLMVRKKRFADLVEERGFRTHSAGGNFFLVKAGIDAKPLTNYLRDEGVLVRDQSSRRGMDGIFRITVGTDEENKRLINLLDSYCKKRAVIFDLDDTLVDTSKSYDSVISELVLSKSGIPLKHGELSALREQGGFNDDWESTHELLRRRNVDVSLDVVSREGKRIYLSKARENEKLLVDPDLFEKLSSRSRLFIFTGRTRDEYEPVWKHALDGYFECVFCKDDFKDLAAKPSPDMLIEIRRKTGIDMGIYVGNSVDDMRSAKEAGMTAIGVASTCSGETLIKAGASMVIDDVNALKGVFRL